MVCDRPPPSGVTLFLGWILPQHLPRALSQQHRAPWWRRGAQFKAKFSVSYFLSPQSHTSSSLRSVQSEGADCPPRGRGFPY